MSNRSTVRNESNISYVLPLLDRRHFPSPALDQRIAEIARCAQHGDTSARDALFAAFQPKIDQSVARFWHRARVSTVWDLSDLRQEGFLAFADLVRSWPGNGSFSAYFLRCFRGRLFDAVRRMEGRVRSFPLTDNAVEAYPIFDAIETRAMLDELSLGWSTLDRTLLLRHIGEGETVAAIAAELAIDPVVGYSRLRAIKARLRRLLIHPVERERVTTTS